MRPCLALWPHGQGRSSPYSLFPGLCPSSGARTPGPYQHGSQDATCPPFLSSPYSSTLLPAGPCIIPPTVWAGAPSSLCVAPPVCPELLGAPCSPSTAHLPHCRHFICRLFNRYTKKEGEGELPPCNGPDPRQRQRSLPQTFQNNEASSSASGGALILGPGGRIKQVASWPALGFVLGWVQQS